ncbi:hypothetical protein PpBr36_01999 [Pyricularia pennisetigena]|uniref:hypothetical protein n=1 Tax=Pyricularia pennisetigena TaxID=1578925 RepID=UPI00114E5136|nr:hypothetical protein PpBr36_01999 [Pyricularia pennisetigena]TLS29247.1 hypothetical protein PpBr36_01999 [Pyricularia pennisetigena]
MVALHNERREVLISCKPLRQSDCIGDHPTAADKSGNTLVLCPEFWGPRPAGSTDGSDFRAVALLKGILQLSFGSGWMQISLANKPNTMNYAEKSKVASQVSANMLELHVPTRFSDAVPAVSYTHAKHPGLKHEIDDMGGLHEDPLAVVEADDGPDEEPFVLEQKRFQGFSLFMFSIRALGAWIFSPKILHKGIFITSRPLRPVVLMSAVDIRSRLQRLFKPRTVYAQNILAFNFTSVPMADVLMGPLSRFARHIRESLMLQTSETQMYAGVQRNLRSIATSGRVPLYADSDSVMVVMSNLTKLSWHDVFNFKPAVVKTGSSGEKDTTGLPVWQVACSESKDSYATSLMLN